MFVWLHSHSCLSHSLPSLFLFLLPQDVSRLNEFVRDESLSFEKETAIKVCKQAGFHEHALYLGKIFLKQLSKFMKIHEYALTFSTAKKHNEHNWYLRILLEDLQKYTEV